MGEQQFNSEDGERQPIVYAELMNPAMVEEQPFYHKGMTISEYQKELAYLNQNQASFLDGSYVPLWKQAWFH